MREEAIKKIEFWCKALQRLGLSSLAIGDICRKKSGGKESRFCTHHELLDIADHLAREWRERRFNQIQHAHRGEMY